MGINTNYATHNVNFTIRYVFPPSQDYIENGALTLNGSASNYGIGLTHGFTTGKWYYEYYVDTIGVIMFGIITMDTFASQKVQPHNRTGVYYVYNGYKGIQTSSSSLSGFSFSSGDILQFAFDRDARKYWVGVNGTYINSGNPSSGSNEVFGSSDFAISTGPFVPFIGLYNPGTTKVTLNAGQDSSFNGEKTSGSANAKDANGFGDFYYTPPTNFLSINSKNASTGTNMDTSAEDGETKNPTTNFGIVTYTGNSTTGQSITGLGFKPDVIWAKCSSHAQFNMLFHSQSLNSRSPTPTPIVYGMDSINRYDDTSFGNNNAVVSSFDDDGFTLGTSGSGPNDNGRTYVAWCWKANAASTVTNNDGDRTSTIQVNADAGFSTGTYTGNLSGSGTATVGHGLGKTPEMIISFRSDGNSQRILRHSMLSSDNHVLQVETTTAETSKSGNGSMSAPNATTFDTNYTDGLNTNGHTFLFMAWTSIPGYSAFGRYYGNGNAAQGAFIYTGFRPRMIMIRRYQGTDSLFVYDSARSPSNKMGNFLQWNDTAAKTGSNLVNFYSNGFQMVSTSASQNPDGSPILYAAWADKPLRVSNAR